MSKHTESIRRVVRFLQTIQDISPQGAVKRNIEACIEYLDKRAAKYILKLETDMGRVAQDLLIASQQSAAKDATIAHLQSQLAAATANALDADDLAALAAFEAANPPAPADDTITGTAAPGTTVPPVSPPAA